MMIVLRSLKRVRSPADRNFDWRCICHLIIQRQDGRIGRGTGWFAGPGLVVTAGHCIVDHQHGGWASKIQIIPEINGSYPPPFGMHDAASVEAHPAWESQADRNFDYGFIQVQRTTVGQQLGWFGFAAIQNSDIPRLMVNIAGYPDDKLDGTLWFNSGRIIEGRPHFSRYMIDTEPGQSGAPVFWYGPQEQRIVVAVHTYNEGRSNMGTRVTTEMYQRVVELRGF